MKRGRPKGSGKRWTEFQNCTLWARITELREAEGMNLRDACNALAHRGLFQAKDGKVWLSNPATYHRDDRLPPLIEIARQGDTRNEDPAETFRAQYYAAERKRKRDPGFQERCQFWLAYQRRYRELRKAGAGRDDAGRQAFSDACETRPIKTRAKKPLP